jgi:hypothetical protein
MRLSEEVLPLTRMLDARRVYVQAFARAGYGLFLDVDTGNV